MANFLEDLWSSIFTPGPTPTLLVATNITFGTLLILLLCLLAATWSIHFLILSVLSLGLWGAINWFAREVSLAQAHEETLAKKDTRPNDTDARRTFDASVDAMDSGDDTETETNDEQREREATPQVSTPTIAPRPDDVSLPSIAATKGAPYNTGAAARLTADKDREVKRRQRQSMAESTGSLSTDSEWEKVEEDQ